MGGTDRKRKVQDIIEEGLKKVGDKQAHERAEEDAQKLYSDYRITTLGTFIMYYRGNKKKLHEDSRLVVALQFLLAAAKKTGNVYVAIFILTSCTLGDWSAMPDTPSNQDEPIYDGTKNLSIRTWFMTRYGNLSERMPSHLVHSFGGDFPLVGRNEVGELVRHTLMERLDLHYTVTEIDKDKVYIPYVGTLPGVGKSRINQDLLQVLKSVCSKESRLGKHLENAVKVLVTFGHGYTLTSWERGEDIVAVYAYRILYAYFVQGRVSKDHDEDLYPLEFEKFIERAWKDPKENRISLLEALDAIALDARTNMPEQKKQSIIIYLGVDEYQKIGQINLEMLIKAMGAVMHYTSLPPENQNFFLIPFFTGTDNNLMFTAIKRSRFQPKYIPLPLLAQDMIENLLDTMAANNFKKLKKWRLWSPFRRCIDDFQGMLLTFPC
jgi:hypothetical protein